MYPIKANIVTNVQLFYFRLFGLWPHKDSGRLYYYYGLIFHFIFSFAYSAFMVINLFLLDDMNQLPDALYMSLTEVALFIKTANFFLRVQSMQGMFRHILSFPLENDDERRLIRERMIFFLKVSIYYYSCANFAIYSSFYSAIVADEVKLPFYGWYPLDWRHKNRDYWICYAYQAIGMYITCNLNITIELFPMFLMFMASVKMEILGRRMQTIGWIGDDRTAACGNTVGMIPFISAAKSSDLSAAFSNTIKSIRIHQDICDFVGNVQHFFSIAYFGQISMSGTVICGLLYMFAKSDDFSYRLSICVMTSAMVSQIFLPCYFGNEIFVASDNLSTKMYEANWLSLPNTHRRAIIIFMERLKRATSIIVGALFMLNMRTFVSIINFAYRLLALLKNF